ncbi:MAG: hypothetical protein L6R39_003965, partial [Caloplaca ligustica]
MVNIVKQIERAFTGDSPSSDQTSPLPKPASTPIRFHISSATSSPLSSAAPSPIWPPNPLWPTLGDFTERRDENFEQKQIVHLTPSKPRLSSSKTSPYFLPSPKAPRESVSCIPFPPLTSTSFGLVQESLASNPFHLLLAVIFLNKTRGAVAMPIFYTFAARFPNPASLAAAAQEEVVGFFATLGLQNQRAKKCIALAKAWLEHPPAKDKRWRRLHYPCLGDGKDIRSGEEPIADETVDGRVAWEVGHLPGIGAYGIDSWRIFCRDELRGLGTAALPDLPPLDDCDGMERVEEEEMQKEWTRV